MPLQEIVERHGIRSATDFLADISPTILAMKKNLNQLRTGGDKKFHKIRTEFISETVEVEGAETAEDEVEEAEGVVYASEG